MISNATKAKIWMWTPFLVLAAFTAILLLVVFNLNRGDLESVDQGDGSAGLGEEKTLVERLAEGYLAANGGAEAIASLRSLRFSGTFETDGQIIPYVSVKKRPSQSHLSLIFPGYKLALVVDGDVVWQRVLVDGEDPVNSLVDEAEAEEIRRLGMFFDPVTMALLLSEGTIDDAFEGDWKGRSCYVLEFRNAELNLDSVAYIDSETLRVLAREDMLDNESKRTLIYSQYETIDGFQHALTTESYVDGELDNRVVVESAQHNIGTFSSFFEFPEKR